MIRGLGLALTASTTTDKSGFLALLFALKLHFTFATIIFARSAEMLTQWDRYILFHKSFYTVWNRSQRLFCWNQMGWYLSDATTVCGHINRVQHKCHNFQNEKTTKSQAILEEHLWIQPSIFVQFFFSLAGSWEVGAYPILSGGKARHPKQFGISLQN